MRIVHVTEQIEGASGVATFVRELNTGLNTFGMDSQMVTVGNLLSLNACDILHIHGLWLPGYHHASQWARYNNIPIVWSTHGMTAPWSMRYKRWKKWLAWRLYQKRDLRHAAMIHCTTDLEVNWNHQLGVDRSFVVPLGTHECSTGETQTHGERIIPHVLFVGRLHPVKGLENLIRAWDEVVHNSKDNDQCMFWHLRIVGPDEGGYLSNLKALVSHLSLDEQVEFAGPKFGSDLSREYDECDCLILPSYTENFGATVVDALAHGKPCIASTFTPWRVLREKGCGWWIGNQPEDLAFVIREMIAIGDVKRREMGIRGCELVKEKFTWDAVTKMMIAEYNKILMV